jgi:ATP-dependent protease ClpP protease subunit
MISNTFHADRATILMAEPFRIDTVRGVIQEFDLACYYRFGIIELELDSPGGESGSFRILTQHLAAARMAQQFRLVTRALGLCASAAALTLSLGDLGHRQAYSFSKLLYHFSRVTPGVTLTAESSSLLSQELAREDVQFVNLLTTHILGRAVEGRHLRSVGISPPASQTARAKRPPTADRTPNRLQSLMQSTSSRTHRDPKDLISTYLSMMQRDSLVSAERAKELRLIDQVL